MSPGQLRPLRPRAPRPRWRRILRRLVRGVSAALFVAIVPTTIFIWVKCYPGGTPRDAGTGVPADIAGYRRSEAFTYLTLPEWFIVYSSDEFGRFTQQASPTAFPYASAVAQYWGYYSAACAVTKSAYPFETGYHVMLGVIGASFTIENAIKAVYENSVGRVTAWFGHDTPEDKFAAQTAAEYGTFMHTVPWYRFPFGARIRRLWSDVPMWGPRPVRKWERRLALTTEYSLKAAYGWVIGRATGTAYAAEDLKVYARVDGATADIFRDSRVEKVRQTGKGAYVIRLPRYEAFTGTALSLVDARVRFVDVAGNRDILITVIAPMSLDDRVFGAGQVIGVGPLLTDPQRKRVAVRVSVERLHEIVPTIRAAGATIEHLYDY
jgi:hypothetical protein